MNNIIKKYYLVILLALLIFAPGASYAQQDSNKRIEEKIKLLRTLLAELQDEVQSSVDEPNYMSSRKINKPKKPPQQKSAASVPPQTYSKYNASSSWEKKYYLKRTQKAKAPINWQKNYFINKTKDLNQSIDWQQAYRRFRMAQKSDRIAPNSHWSSNTNSAVTNERLQNFWENKTGSTRQIQTANLYGYDKTEEPIFKLPSTPIHVFGNKEAKHPFRLAVTGKIGNKRSIIQSEIFLPVHQSKDHMLFADLRVMGDTNRVQEGNFGIGFRKVMGATIMGAYLYGDLRKSEHKNQFKQLTVGAEVLSENFDFRMNAYLPKADKYAIGPIPTLSGGFQPAGHHFVRPSNLGDNTYEVPSKGVDIEAGLRIPIQPLINKMRHSYFKFHGAGYAFKNAYMNTLIGVRGRAEIETQNMFIYGSVFSFGGELSYDRLRGKNAFLHARIAMPLQSMKDCGVPTGLAARLGEPVVRDVDIVSFNHGINPKNGKLLPKDEILSNANKTAKRFIYVDGRSNTNGTGTYEQPLTSLEEAFEMADQDGDIIYINSGDYVQNKTLSPKANIDIVGAGSPLRIEHINGEKYVLKPQSNTSILRFNDTNIKIKNKSVTISGLNITNFENINTGYGILAEYNDSDARKHYMLNIKDIIAENKELGGKVVHTGASQLTVDNKYSYYQNNWSKGFELIGLSPEKTRVKNDYVHFNENSPQNSGAGDIYGAHMTNATITIDNCQFNKNKTTNGKAFGLRTTNTPKLHINNSQLNMNRSDNNTAQALAMSGTGSDSKIQNSSFSGQFSNISADNIVLELPSGAANVQITDCKFEQNKSTNKTIGIQALNSTNFLIDKSLFSEKQASVMTAIRVDGSNGKITNCRIADNETLGGNFVGIKMKNTSTVEIKDNEFTNNNPIVGVGATSSQISLDGTGTKNVTISGNKIIGNIRTRGIRVNNGTSTVSIMSTPKPNIISGNNIGLHRVAGAPGATITFNGNGIDVTTPADIDETQVFGNTLDYDGS